MSSYIPLYAQLLSPHICNLHAFSSCNTYFSYYRAFVVVIVVAIAIQLATGSILQKHILSSESLDLKQRQEGQAGPRWFVQLRLNIQPKIQNCYIHGGFSSHCTMHARFKSLVFNFLFLDKSDGAGLLSLLKRQGTSTATLYCKLLSDTYMYTLHFVCMFYQPMASCCNPVSLSCISTS